MQLLDSRIKFQRYGMMHKHIEQLFNEPVCNSDDEEGPNGMFHRFSMPSRSAKATTFLHSIDDFKLLSDKATSGKKRAKKQTRIEHPDSTASDASLPSPAVALDWHDPDHFNALPAHIRGRYRNSPIVLPLAEKMGEKGWEKMDKVEFMKKYGKEVKGLYKIPTREEIEEMEDGVGKTDSEEDSEAADDLMDTDGDQPQASGSGGGQ